MNVNAVKLHGGGAQALPCIDAISIDNEWRCQSGGPLGFGESGIDIQAVVQFFTPFPSDLFFPLLMF
jgi:hypothetical protein